MRNLNRDRARRSRAALALAAAAIWFAAWANGYVPGPGPGAASGAPSFGEAVFTLGQAGPQTNPKPKPNPPAAPPAPEKPAPPPALSDRIAEYHIGVALDAETRSLHGSQTVTWRNPGKKKVQELYFHLYPNAFASDKTTFIRESGGKLRDARRTAEGYGFMTVDSVESSDGLVLTHRMEYAQPDDGNPHDRTLMRLSLPQPVEPGEAVTLRMTFTVKLPEVFARMGYKGDFYMIGQWHPKLAVYEPAGTRGRAEEGWNAHQYHGNSEYYADFAIYNVKITVPANFVVAATGFPAKPAAENKKTGMKTYHFYAEDVHDFAWAASPNFIYAEEPYSARNVPGVKIKLYLDPTHLELKERYLRAVKASLKMYGEWFGPYPYSTLSVVVPPAGADGAGGMEYPTLITAWAAGGPAAGLSLERVVAHEIAHQFWYGMVANNEFEEAWLDEAFASYAEEKLMREEYGVPPLTALEAVYVTNPAPLARLSWQYDSHDHYAENVYTRGKLVLLAMEREIGEAKMKRVLREYFRKWKFKHPSTADFLRTAEEVTGRSWAEFFDQFVYGGGMADYAVQSIVREPSPPGTYAYRVTVAAKGGKAGPLYVRFAYADGRSVRQLWSGAESEVVFRLPPHTAELRYVAVDPDREVVLEHRRINNFLKTEVDDRQKTRWTLGAAKLVELLLGAVVW